jgi:hypothetical protein
LKFRINYNGRYSDEIIIEAETIEEIKQIAFEECEKRNWNTSDCWSERI